MLRMGTDGQNPRKAYPQGGYALIFNAMHQKKKKYKIIIFFAL